MFLYIYNPIERKFSWKKTISEHSKIVQTSAIVLKLFVACRSCKKAPMWTVTQFEPVARVPRSLLALSHRVHIPVNENDVLDSGGSDLQDPPDQAVLGTSCLLGETGKTKVYITSWRNMLILLKKKKERNLKVESLRRGPFYTLYLSYATTLQVI